MSAEVLAAASSALWRDQLGERRRRLLARPSGAGAEQIQRLLRDVDAALERLEDGSFGLCDVCHEAVETPRLMADPLCRLCLEHLLPEQRHALEHDLELARDIQVALLPGRSLALPGWDVAAHYVPAGPVSGDYYDVIPLRGSPGDTLVVFGDVSGKGVSASLLMASLQATFRSLADVGLPLAEIVGRANRIFGENTLASWYATLICGRLSRAGQLELVSAGHWPPLLVRGGRVETLPAAGLPLGLFASGVYAPIRVDLDPGDSVLLYTDGLSEARTASGEEYGVERITAVLGGREHATPEHLVRRLLEDVTQFRGSRPLADDLTVLALRRTSES